VKRVAARVSCLIYNMCRVEGTRSIARKVGAGGRGAAWPWSVVLITTGP
jgi:hypothetical protein